MEQEIVSFITIVGGFLAFGAFLDQLLITSTTKKKIKSFLSKNSSGNIKSKEFFNFLSIVYEVVFSRWLNSSFFSLRYFLVCSVISVSSVVIIFIIQYLNNPIPFYSIKLTQSQIIVILSCIFINIVIDWISIKQTQVFFEISRTVSSISKAVLLIISDLVLTINLFSLIYSYAMTGVVVFDDLQGDDMHIISTVSIKKLNKDSKDFEKASKIFNSNNIYDFYYYPKINSTVEEKSKKSLFTFYSDTPNITINDILQIVLTKNSYNVKKEEIFLSKADVTFKCLLENKKPKCDDLLEENILLSGRRGEKEWSDLKKEGFNQEVEKIDFKLYAMKDNPDFQMAYTISYDKVDFVQDSFPQSLTPYMITLSYKELFTNYYSAKKLRNIEMNESNSHLHACHIDGFGWVSQTTKYIFANDCNKKMIIPAGYVAHFLTDLKSVPSKLSGVQLPLNTLFMTSLLSTFLLYLIAMFLFASKCLKKFSFKGLKKIEKFYLRSPLQASGIVLGLIFYFLLKLIN